MSIPFFILVVILAVAVAVWIARRDAGGTRASGGRAPRRRHPYVRAACGLLGFGLLAAVGLATGLDARASYGPGEAAPLGTVRGPAAAVPPPAADRITSGRFLLHFVVVEAASDRVRPIQVVEEEIRLPQDAARELRPALRVPGYDVELGCTVQAVVRSEEGLRPEGEMALTVSRFLGKSMMSGTLNGPNIGFPDRGYRPKNPLSLSPGRPRAYSMFCFPTRVADDDPLRTIPAEEVARPNEARIRSAVRAVDVSARGGDLETAALGLRFVDHVGVTSLFLLLAAALLSQTARRKSLAFAGWLAAIVILAGAMDRAALGVHVGRLSDPQATVRDRRLACARLGETFFFRKTALRAVDPLLNDPELRDLARKVRATLEN